MTDFVHVLITRFNLGIQQLGPEAGHWMVDRWGLFKHYCLPSVRGQLSRDFLWVICVDKATPRKWLNKIYGCCSDPNIIVVLLNTRKRSFLDKEINQGIRRCVLGLVPATVSTLVTTTLDNDDMLASYSVQRINGFVRAGVKSPHVLDPESVSRLHEKSGTLAVEACSMRVRASTWASPFYTLVEPRDNAQTSAVLSHNEARIAVKDYTVLAGHHACRVEHDANFSSLGCGTHCAEQASREKLTYDMLERLQAQFSMDPSRVDMGAALEAENGNVTSIRVVMRRVLDS